MYHIALSALRGVEPGRLAVRPDYYPIAATGYPLRGRAVPTGVWVILSRVPLEGAGPGGLRHPRQAYAGLHAYPLPTRRAAVEVAQRIIRRRRGVRKPLTEVRAAITLAEERAAQAQHEATVALAVDTAPSPTAVFWSGAR